MEQTQHHSVADLGHHNDVAGTKSAAMPTTALAFGGVLTASRESEKVRDRRPAVVAESVASVVPAPHVQPPAFLSMPNWTVEETADYCRCQAQTIRKALSLSGTFWGLKPRRFGRRWLFNAGEVRAVVEGR